MKIKMKETKKGSPDGILVFDYQKGKTYDPPESLANAFVRAGWATIVKPEKPPEEKVEKPPETKVIEPPETKEEGKGIGGALKNLAKGAVEKLKDIKSSESKEEEEGEPKEEAPPEAGDEEKDKQDELKDKEKK